MEQGTAQKLAVASRQRNYCKPECARNHEQIVFIGDVSRLSVPDRHQSARYNGVV